MKAQKKQLQQMSNKFVDEDEEFTVVLRKEYAGTACCSNNCYFKNKITGELFGSPMILKGYLHDAEGNLLDSPDIDSLDNYEVLEYD